MKYICNGIVAVMLSLFIVYGLFVLITSSKGASKKELIDECDVAFNHSSCDILCCKKND